MIKYKTTDKEREILHELKGEIGLFESYLLTNTKLDHLEHDMMKLAENQGIPNAKSIHYYGIEGLVKRASNGLYLGGYRYGEENHYLFIRFSMRIDQKNVNNSDVMMTGAMIVKENEIVAKEQWR